jgi:hypothetical protein
MVCLLNICINTLHKGAKDAAVVAAAAAADDNDNNNNNNKGFRTHFFQSLLNVYTYLSK